MELTCEWNTAVIRKFGCFVSTASFLCGPVGTRNEYKTHYTKHGVNPVTPNPTVMAAAKSQFRGRAMSCHYPLCAALPRPSKYTA